jgi:hypothetical protein
MPRLHLRICGARNLHNPQSVGQIDPYCTVSHESMQWRTSVAHNTLNPEWNQVFKFHVSDENSARLHFVIWDNNLMSDDFLGEYYLSIAGLARGHVKDEWVLLNNAKSNAELHIRTMVVEYDAIADSELTPPHPQYRQYGGGQSASCPAPPHKTDLGETDSHLQKDDPQQACCVGVERFFGIPVLLRTHHGTVVRAHPGCGATVDIKSFVPATWERFILEPRDNGTFTIRTYHRSWLRAYPGPDGANIDTQTESPREWEEWRAEPAPADGPGGEGWYYLRSHHGTRMRCYPGPDGSRVDLQSHPPGEWERIYIDAVDCPQLQLAAPIEQLGSAPYYGLEHFFRRPVLLCTHHGTVVRAHRGRGAAVVIKSEVPLEWERFILEPRDNGTFTIRTFHASWLSANPGGEGARITTQVDAPGEWEEWRAEPAPGNQGGYYLRSHHGTRMRCFPGPDGSRVDLQSNNPGEWERINIVLA